LRDKNPSIKRPQARKGVRQKKGSGLNGTNLRRNPFSQYDLADRVTYTDNADSVDMPQVQLRSYYDFEGNRTWLSDSQGGSVWYAWNNQRLQSMALYTGDYKSAQVGFSYDPVGRLSSLTRTANGDFATTINTGYTLDLLNRVTSITHSKGMGEDASTLSQFTYGYDVGGRVVGSKGPEGSLSFALDANGQLLSVTGSRTDNYSFDATGNRSSSTTAAGNLLLNDGKFNYTYDLEGNQKTKTRISDGQMTEFFWDYRNQLTKAMVKDANGVLIKELRFTYDVEGRRVGSWVDADGAGPEEPDQVWTVFDGVNPYMDFDGDGLLKTRYLYGPGIDELFARIGKGDDPQWYLADRLGSVRQIVDASGAVLDEITYDSFGNVLSETGPAQGDRFKFTGREYSPELGIYYYRARWYDPGSGRFISQDPIGFSAGDVNLYRYVGNAPGDATDPWGLQTKEQFKTTITNNGQGIQISCNENFKAKQWFMLEVTAYFCLDGKKEISLTLKPGIDLDLQSKDGIKPHNHDHNHFTGVNAVPNWKKDNGVDFFGKPNLWYPLKPDPKKPGTFIYSDTPNATEIFLSLPSETLLNELTQIENKIKNPEHRYKLDNIRITQKFITLIYTNGIASEVVFWSKQSIGLPKNNPFSFTQVHGSFPFPEGMVPDSPVFWGFIGLMLLANGRPGQ